ncbi:Trk system potassium transporter TrkA [bacterium]|nr:Trk system potassium transporter TrkA [candidate division CSSED10-310 bacterium]
MRIVIIGAGMVGSSLAEELIFEGHDISIVEKDGELCRTIEEKFDVLVSHGSGSNPSILKYAGIEKADLLLAVTPDDEINIMACIIARQFNVKERIARIRSEDFLLNPPIVRLQELGVSRIIDPEKSVVESIMQFLQTPGAIEASAFENGKILMREFRITTDMPVVNKTLHEIRQMVKQHQILVMTILRNDLAIIPTGDEVVAENDEILAIFPAESLDAFLKLMNNQRGQVRKVIISGGTLTSLKLAKLLDKLIDQVILVVPDYDYGKQVANQLEQVEVLHGDCTDLDLLREIHAERADFFVGCNKNTDNNILASLLAKSLGTKEIIALSDQPRKSNRMFKSIGIDHVINPRLTTASAIMDIIHRGRMLSEIRIRDMDLEAVRILTGNNSKISNKPLKSAWKPLANKAIVGAIIRDEQLIIPEGESVLLPGDQAMIITREKTLDEIKRMFRERP